MKRKFKVILCLLLTLTLCFSMGACGGGTSKSAASEGEEKGEIYQFSAAWLAAEKTPIVQEAKRLAANLEEKTDGRILMTIYHSQQISTSDRENGEKVQQNIVQMSTLPTFTAAELSGIREFSIVDLPFLFKDESELDKLFDSEVMQPYYDQLYDKLGVRYYGSFLTGWMKVGTTKKAFKVPGDIKGLKIRTQASETFIKTLDAWGAAPTPMAFGEVFTALQQGTVDGMIGATQMVYDEGFYEALKYVADVNPFATYHVTIVNDQWYQGLPDDLKVIFDECMAEFIADIRPAMTKSEQDSMAGIDAYENSEMVYLTDAERAEWAALTEPLFNSIASDVVGKEFVNEVKAFLGK